MKWELCPPSCLFDPEGLLPENSCGQCWHVNDVLFDPPRDGVVTFGTKSETCTVIAVNGGVYWIQTIMSNGQPSRGTVDRSHVKFA